MASPTLRANISRVEAHPYYTQKELRKTLDQYGIKLMAWYPLGHGDKALIQEPIFAKLGEKYGKSPAQVILRWHTQMGFAVIPGSKNIDHIRDNLNILDFRLTDEEMAEIAKLDKGVRYYTRTDEALQIPIKKAAAGFVPVNRPCRAGSVSAYCVPAEPSRTHYRRSASSPFTGTLNNWRKRQLPAFRPSA